MGQGLDHIHHSTESDTDWDVDVETELGSGHARDVETGVTGRESTFPAHCRTSSNAPTILADGSIVRGLACMKGSEAVYEVNASTTKRLDVIPDV